MASLGRVLCDNGDNITRITDDVFLLPGIQGGYKDCKEIPKINLAVWLNCDKCSAHQDPNTFYVDPTLPRSTRRRRSVSDSDVDKYTPLDENGNFFPKKKSKEEFERSVERIEDRIAELQDELKILEEKMKPKGFSEFFSRFADFFSF